MKFSIIIGLILSPIFVVAGVSGGSGGFPTDSYIISEKLKDTAIGPDDYITSLNLLKGSNSNTNITESWHKQHSLWDLSINNEIYVDETIDLDGFRRVEVLPIDSAEKEQGEAISRGYMYRVLTEFSDYAPNEDEKTKYINSAEKVKSGKLDLIYINDEEKVILLDSSKDN